MKNDIVIVTAYCDTQKKIDVLRSLIDQLTTQKEHFDVMIVSHSIIPMDICEKVNFVFYDKKNELLYDWDLRSTPWFNPGNERAILSVFTGFFNTHLAIWRMIILGNAIAKNCGYSKAHHLEYDCSIKDFSEFKNNSILLDNYDAITYTKVVETVDPILFGTFQSYRLDFLHEDLLNLNEEKIIRTIKSSEDKSPERMLYDLLNHRRKIFVKQKNILDKNGNQFGMSHNKISNNNTAWCLPFYDQLTEKLGFVIWNMEEPEHEISVQIYYNDDKIINFDKILPKHWRMIDIDDYQNAKKLVVILNNKIRNIFEFDEYREEFKKYSFRQNFKR